MSHVKINLPVLVSRSQLQGSEEYVLQPLFIPHPTVAHKRFERAVTKFQSQVRRQFKGFILSRETMDRILWYQFNPRYSFKIFDLEFLAGKQFVKGKFSAAYFVLKGNCFVCLPSFSNYFFIARKDENGKFDIPLEIEAIIQRIVREQKKDGGEKLDLNVHMAGKDDFVTNIEFSIQVEDGKFDFEESSLDFFFSSLGGGFDFSGAAEIEKVGFNLNERYPGDIGRAFYRENEVTRVSNIIYGSENTPIVLLGEEGVGKTSIINEVVRRYCDDNRKTKAENKERVYVVDPTRIIAGMSIVGMWQKRFEAILDYVISRRKHLNCGTDKIVFSNIVSILRIGKSASNDMTLGDVLKPYLEKRILQVVLIATPQEWKVLQEKDRRFADLFQIVRLEEPDLSTAVKMVVEQRKFLELEFNCQISTQAITLLFAIHRNYFRRKALPGSVMKLLTQLAVKHQNGTVDPREVKSGFKEYSGLDKDIFDDNYVFEIDEVKSRISENLVGQFAAVACLDDVIHTVKAKLNNNEKPLGSFLFIGPTGVGKTQAAKVVCQYLMGDENKLLRFDMNEYIDESAIQRLIGDFYNPEGQLTGRVRYNPFGVILFDEIEKAHPKVHDLLLQVLDDGRLTDSLGRTTDFSNSIVIMTSNVGARDVSNKLGFKDSASEDEALFRKAVENTFRPEFVNRIEKIVIFQSLGLEHILNIARLQIKELLSRDGFVRRSTILSISTEAVEWVARRGFDAKMGGRALKRQIENDLTSLSADQLVRSYVDRPIIFEIILKNGSLYPRISPLDFVANLPGGWLPKLPDEKSGRKFYSKMLKDLDKLERKINKSAVSENRKGGVVIITDENDSLDWQYYWFKDQISEFKENLRRKILGFGHAILEKSPVNSFRLKRAKTSSIVQKNEKSGTKLDRTIQKDKLFQEEGMDEIRDMYMYSQTHFDKIQSQYLIDLLDFNFLNLFSNGFLADKRDKTIMRFESCVAHLGSKQIEFLLNLYEKLFKKMEIQYQLIRKAQTISVEGHSIYNLLKGEEGIHLFHLPHQNPLPVKLILTKEETEASDDFPKVIRVYDGDSTITDVRTGFTNDLNISTNELKLFLFGGMASLGLVKY